MMTKIEQSIDHYYTICSHSRRTKNILYDWQTQNKIYFFTPLFGYEIHYFSDIFASTHSIQFGFSFIRCYDIN